MFFTCLVYSLIIYSPYTFLIKFFLIFPKKKYIICSYICNKIKQGFLDADVGKRDIST